MAEQRPWWTVRQIAELYGMSARAIYAAIEAKQLISHRFGTGRGAIRIADRDRINWEAACRDGLPREEPERFLRHTDRAENAKLVKKHLGRL